MSENLAGLFRDLAVQIPSLLTIIVCAICAVIRWKHHPRVSLAVLISLALLLIHLFIFAVVYAWVPEWIIRSANQANRSTVTRNVYIVMAVIYNVLEAVPFVVLLVAIFMRRKHPQQFAV